MTTQTSPSGIDYVRTPDERFDGLDDFAYEPKYGNVDGLRMAYIDEGPEDAHPILLLHGEPSWSYLYRRMIPVLLDAGYRVVAPDLIGFGRSDKPTDPGYYTYARHVANVEYFLDATLDRPCTLFAQDWGGLIGLQLVGLQPERFDRSSSATPDCRSVRRSARGSTSGSRSLKSHSSPTSANCSAGRSPLAN